MAGRGITSGRAVPEARNCSRTATSRELREPGSRAQRFPPRARRYNRDTAGGRLESTWKLEPNIATAFGANSLAMRYHGVACGLTIS